LIAGPPDSRFSLSANRQNRRVVEFGIVQARDQVGGTGTAGRQTDSDLTGELGVGHRHEGRHFFVPDLDEFDFVCSLQRSDHAVDAVTRVPVDPSNTPRVQAVNNEIANFHEEAPEFADA
jgi:hypothetical protein